MRKTVFLKNVCTKNLGREEAPPPRIRTFSSQTDVFPVKLLLPLYLSTLALLIHPSKMNPKANAQKKQREEIARIFVKPSSVAFLRRACNAPGKNDRETGGCFKTSVVKSRLNQYCNNFYFWRTL
ncbi:MAG: hypothetical protein LBT00_01400 [Spirochaetaceae bacterium]|jgi:hypothetical protein|nr:hypothetical protein [Spirochaetaceae bacterium]